MATEPVVLGNLACDAPTTLARSRQGNALTLAAGPKSNEAIVWHGPLPRVPGQSLAQALEAEIAGRFAKAAKVEKAEAVHPLTVPSGLPAVATARRYRRGEAPLFAFHALFESCGQAYLLTAVASTPDGFRRLIGGDLKVVADSARLHLPSFAAPALAEGSTPFARAGVALAVPPSWLAGTGRAPVGGQRFVRKLGEGVKDGAMVAIAARVGTPSDPEAALRRVLLADLGPVLFGEALGAEVEPIRVVGWQTATGARGSHLALHVKAKGKIVATLGGHLVTGEGVTAVAAALLRHESVKSGGERQAATLFDGLCNEMGFVLAGARFAAPSARRFEAEAELAKRGSYAYRYTGSFGGAMTTWIVDEDRTTWRFLADGTCTCEDDNYFGMSSSYRDDAGDPSRITGTSHVTSSGQGGKGRARYEVRAPEGAGPNDLVLVVYPEGSDLGDPHALAFDLTTKYGVYKPRGLAIDGVVEGKYEEGDRYQVYSAPGE